MERGIDALKTALRVLTAVVDMRKPHLADVEQLRRFAPLRADALPGELAVDVLHQAVKRVRLAIDRELGTKKRKGPETVSGG
jgi:hypothetical protein